MARKAYLKPETIRACLELQGKASARSVAQMLQIGLSTVYRIWELNPNVDNDLYLEEGEQLLATPTKCTKGHKTRIVPCRECRILAFKEESRMITSMMQCPQCDAPHVEARRRRNSKQWRCVKHGHFIRNATPAELAGDAHPVTSVESLPNSESVVRTVGPIANGDGTAARSA